MSWTVEIDSTDVTSKVRQSSLSIQDILTKRVNSANLTLFKGATKPTIHDDISIIEDGTTIFGGRVKNMQTTIDNVDDVNYTLTCKDYTDLADSKLIAETYIDKTVNYIIDDINTKYLDGFTITGVDCDIVVNNIQFNWEVFSACMEKLAEYTGYDWYIDYAKDIKFFDYSGNSAPFDFDDDNQSYLKGTVSVIESSDQIKNAVFIRGGKYNAEEATVSFLADGEAVAYSSQYQWGSGFTVTVDSTPQTVGIDGIHEAADYDCLYNDAERLLRWRADNKPSAADVISITGTPRYTLLAATEDGASIATYGRKEVLIIDKSIKDKLGARQRAEAEMDDFKNPQVEMTFQTLKAGLQAGQILTCNSSVFGFTGETYKVYAVTTEPFTSNKFKYTVELVSTRTLEYVDLMIKFLRARAVADDVESNQVIEKIKLYLETIYFSDSASMTLNGTEWDYCVGHIEPTTNKRNFILNGSKLG